MPLLQTNKSIDNLMQIAIDPCMSMRKWANAMRVEGKLGSVGGLLAKNEGKWGRGLIRKGNERESKEKEGKKKNVNEKIKTNNEHERISERRETGM